MDAALNAQNLTLQITMQYETIFNSATAVTEPLICPCPDQSACVRDTEHPAYAIIVAAGQGKRMGGKSNKAFADLLGTQVIIRTLQTVSDCPCIKGIFVVAKTEEIPAMQALIAGQWPESRIVLVSGGATRQDSVFCGLHALVESLEQSADGTLDPLVAIHDGARCLVTHEVICRTLMHAMVCGPCAAAVPVKDTIKVANAEGRVQSTLDRSGLFAMQTPQVARLSVLITAFTRAKKSGFTATDDLSVLEAAGIAVDLVPGDERNIKLTTPFDLMIARAILSAKRAGQSE